MAVVDVRHCSKLQNVMMYPVQLVDVLSDTFRPLVESAINVSTELDEIIAGQPVKGYVHSCTSLICELLPTQAAADVWVCTQ